MSKFIDLITKHNIKIKKSLGQNFLINPNIAKKIVKSCHSNDGDIIEIGPGLGILSETILSQSNNKLIAIEYDKQLTDLHQAIKQKYCNRFQIIYEDALSIDMHKLGKAPRSIIANLPYNISVPIILKLLQNHTCYKEIIIMVQTEVFNRLIATKQSKDYSRLSIVTQWLCDVKKITHVSNYEFYPQPKIQSTVVKLIPRHSYYPVSFSTLNTIVKISFSKRRKKIKSNLLALDKIINPEQVLQLCKLANIDYNKRAEEITIEEFCELTKQYSKFN